MEAAGQLPAQLGGREALHTLLMRLCMRTELVGEEVGRAEEPRAAPQEDTELVRQLARICELDEATFGALFEKLRSTLQPAAAERTFGEEILAPLVEMSQGCSVEATAVPVLRDAVSTPTAWPL